MSMTVVRAGFRQGLGRLWTRSAAGLVVVALLLSGLVALVESMQAPWVATVTVDRSLRGPGFGLVIPLVCLAMAARVVGPGTPEQAAQAIAGLGGSRRPMVLGLVGASVVGCALLAALAAAATALVGYGSHGAAGAYAGGALGDIGTASWVGALTGAAYGSYYTAAACVGRGGWGRWVALVADLALGLTTGFGALVFPRAHGLNLLGAEALLGFPQWASSLSLGLLGVAYALLVPLLTRR